MKKSVRLISVVLSLIFVFSLSSCVKTEDEADLWSNAVYTEDTELGDGETTVTVKVQVEDNSVTFTINTDKTTLGEALIEHELVAGEEGPYGLYVKAVNGITADYDVDCSYWSFSKDGEYMMAGIDATEISDGEHYELTYTK